MDNKLTIAAAGSGKTTQLIKDSIKKIDAPTLITTYTEANANEIRKKYILSLGYVPPYITIKTWFSLLIQHGIKPFQSYLFEKKVKGMLLVSKKSAFRFKNEQGFPIYWGEKDFYKHYFTEDMRIYSDKLSKLVYKLNVESKGKVIDRITKLYPTIFVDECQDLAGYDLELIKLLSIHSLKLRLVCDPRQVTYLTHNESKYKKYRNGLIHDFINDECKKMNFKVDINSLSHSHRCNQSICNFSNKLYPKIYQCGSKQLKKTMHDGVFLVDARDKERYLKTFTPVQLRWDIKNNSIHPDFEVYNFGQSKGLTFERVLIYPTKAMISWLKDHNSRLTDKTRAKFYVALTRAKFSVGIVCNIENDYDMAGLKIFE